MQSNIVLVDLIQQKLKSVTFKSPSNNIPETSPYYVSVFLKDIESKTYYPLLIKIEKADSNIDCCITNPIATGLLDMHGISISDINLMEDSNSFIEAVNARIDIAKMGTAFLAVPGNTYLSLDDFLFIKHYLDIKDLLSRENIDNRFSSFISTTKIQANKISQDISTEIITKDFSTIEGMINEHGSYKVIGSDIKNAISFLIPLLEELALKEKTTSFIANQTTTDEIKKELSYLKVDYLIDKPTLLKEDFCLPAIPTCLENLSDTSYDNAIETQYRKILSERENSIAYVRDTILSVPQELLSRVLDYTGEEIAIDALELPYLEKDISFLKLLDKMEEIEEGKFVNNTYKGLSVSGKRENYDSLNALLDELLSAIVNFRTIINRQGLRNFNGTRINCLKDFENYTENIQILSEYSGFPLKYFSLEQDGQDLALLQSLYQVSSSSRLTLSSIFDRSFFSLDLPELSRQLTSSSLRQRSKAYSIIKKHIAQTKYLSDKQTVFRLLETYVKSENEINEKVEQYSKIYGNSVRNMNGVVETLNNIRYIRKFKNRSKKDKSFTFENEVVKKCLTDRNYISLLSKESHEDREEYQKLKALINMYIGYFLDDQRNFVSMSFDDLLTFFKTKQNGTYEDFASFAEIKTLAEEISIPLHLKLNKAISEKKNLKEFIDAYLYSLLKKTYENETSSQDKIAFKQHTTNFLLRFKNLRKIETDIIYKTMADAENKITSTIHFLDVYQRLKTYKKNKKVPSAELYDSCVHKIKPMYFFDKDNFDALHSNQSDFVIIFNSKELTDIELITTALSGKTILFIDTQDSIDSRTAFCCSSYIDHYSLFYKKYDRRVIPQIISKIEKTFQSKGIQFRKNNLFPYNVEINSVECPIIFDMFVPTGKITETYVDLRKYMYLAKDSILLDIDIVAFFLNPEEEIKSIIEYHSMMLPSDKKDSD